MKKTQRLGLLLTEREKLWVLNLAKIEGGLTQAALIRRLINKAGKEHGLCLNLYQGVVSPDFRPEGECKRGTVNLPHVEDENRKKNLIGINEKTPKEIEQ